MCKKVVRINSRLYNDLWETGGDKLLAVYCTLKAYKKEIKYYAYTAKNNKFIGGFSLLRAQTNLTLHCIKKYVPVLIDKGLCFIDKNGDFVMLGGEKTKEMYNCNKIVPIIIGKNITRTSYNCISVRLFSAEKSQKSMIVKKQTRREQLKQLTNPTSLKAYKTAKRIEKKFGTTFKITDKTVFSNQSYALLKDNTANNKSKGQYWKSRLVLNNIVKSERRYIYGEKMSYKDYKFYKENCQFPKASVYRDGKIAREIVSSFSSIDLVNLLDCVKGKASCFKLV